MARPLAHLVLAALLAGWWAVGRPARGDDPSARPGPRPAGVKVRVERDDGTRVEGVITAPDALRVEGEYATFRLKLDKVKAIDFANTPNGPLAVVELTDGNHLRGRPEFGTLVLARDGGPDEPLAVKELRELKVLREADHSLLAIVLGLVTLSVMEIVLGIDNIIFLAIVAGRLPPSQQPRARKIGLTAALGTRILLLFTLSFLLGLSRPVFALPFGFLGPDAAEVSWRDIILFAGGLFLIGKSVMELHHKMEEARGKAATATVADGKPAKRAPSFAKVIAQIAVIDIVFSLDSVITAVGMVDILWVMIAAMVVAMGVMWQFADPVSNFVDRHPTVKVLALSFLILIGVLLVAESLGQHIDKGYVYFAMGFAVVMEFLNLRLRPKGVTGHIVGEPDASVAPAGNAPPAA